METDGTRNRNCIPNETQIRGLRSEHQINAQPLISQDQKPRSDPEQSFSYYYTKLPTYNFPYSPNNATFCWFSVHHRQHYSLPPLPAPPSSPPFLARLSRLCVLSKSNIQ
ncbi:hypothetical protein ACOSQ3_003402 [Xanthoceras sorbifolium]